MESLIDELLPIAREVLKDSRAEAKGSKSGIWNQNSIIEIYENYTAAFPVMIDQMGLRTVVAIYNVSDSSKSDGDKKLILQLLFKILTKGNLSESVYPDFLSLVNAIMDDQTGSIVNFYEEYFSDAAIALKRAIRTFPLTKKTGS
ncbi:MAG: type III-B CRISPR module-associated protein Cmr5 [Bacteroidota bacterium]